MNVFTNDDLGTLKSVVEQFQPGGLDRRELSSLYSLLTGRKWNPVWNPFPGPQTEAYDSPADELFYGGAAGGGKSALLLGLALTSHKRSLFLRRESTDLGAIVGEAQTIAPAPFRWKSIGPYGGVLTLKDGRMVEFKGCKDEEDKHSFAGDPHDLLCFDELPHFSRSMFKFIIGWNRSTDAKQRCRVVCAGNPPTSPEARWVVEEWGPWLDDKHPHPARPGELRWYTTIDGKTEWFDTGEEFTHRGMKIRPRSRTFIPALLKHNPALERTGYYAVLQSLPEPLRTQLLEGDMNVGQDDHEWQLIPTEWVDLAMGRWKEDGGKDFPLHCLGVDIARGGKDKTCMAPRRGTWFGRIKKYPGKATPDGAETAGLIEKMMEGECTVNIDLTGGWGTSPYDILKVLYPGRIKGIVYSSKEGIEHLKDRSKMHGFANTRAAMYWAMREALDPIHGEGLALPPDPELRADLCAPRYMIKASGILVESKDEIIKRIGRSPDAGDAIVQALWSGGKKKFWIK